MLDWSVLADPWRAKSDLEEKRDKLRAVTYEGIENIVQNLPSECACFYNPERMADIIAYAFWHYYHFIGKRVERRLEKMLNIKFK